MAADVVYARPLKNYPTLRLRSIVVMKERYAELDPAAADETRWHRAYAQLLKEFPGLDRKLVVFAMANAYQDL
jgi:hypothetical protein